MSNPSGQPSVHLRGVRDADKALLEQWRHDAEARQPFDWFGYPAPHRGDVALPAGGELLVVADDGEPAGAVSWHPVLYGPPPESVAWNIGIALLPAYRGKGIGSAAQRQLADYLFQHTRANRLEASTDVENVAEQRALEKAGFRREGVVRGAQWRNGAWHDLVVYARLREDPTPE